MFDLIGFDLPDPKRVKTSILVIGATQDRSVLPREYEATANRYQTKPVMFKMTHNMMLEDGWLKVADCILEWLSDRDFSSQACF